MFFNSSFYYVTIALQIICVVHCLRKGTQTMWIWLIIFLPLVGCVAYIVLEMFKTVTLRQVQSGVGNVLFASVKIKKLEKQLQFSDTFNNRILLADAHLASGNTDKAIKIYEGSLTGAFTENEHVLRQLITAYFETKRYEDLVIVAKKMYDKPQFFRSHANVLYAIALDKTGKPDLAEKEFSGMKTKYSYYEARYQYGLFLISHQRFEEAQKVFSDIVDEFSYLSSFEKRNNRVWYNAAKSELKRNEAVSAG